MENCKKCKATYNCDESLKCAGCAQSFHVKCVSDASLTTQLLQTVKKFSCFKWFCAECNSAYTDVCGRFTSLQQTISTNEKANSEKFECIMKAMKQLEEKINKNNESVLDEFKKADKRSFSDVVKNSCDDENCVVYIKSKDANKTRQETKSIIREKIDPVKIPVKGMYNAANEGILIKCSNKEAAKTVSDEITKNFNEELEVSIPSVKFPRVRIANVFESKEIAHDVLSKKIKEQNNDVFEENSALKIIKIETNRRNENLISVIIEIEPYVYSKIMAKKKILIGWSSCIVYDAVDLKRCFKCSLFGHLGDKCRNQQVCPRCSKNHELKNCNTRTEKCINCVRSNQNQNTKLNTNHAVWDRNCPIYKKRLELKKKSIKYQ